jgi:signal transduction histidine kinase
VSAVIVPRPGSRAKGFAANRSLHGDWRAARRLYTSVVNAPDLSGEHALPTHWVIAIGIGTAAVLALAVSTQTYLSMLGHGHSFRRILIWQLSAWSFWGFVAPLVLRRGAVAASPSRAGWSIFLRLAALGVVLIAAHAALVAQLAVWVQPFTPVDTYSFRGAVRGQAPALIAIDSLAYVLLLALGGALAAHDRARRLELRESRLEAELSRAQLHALRLEIEPHFLFNTLNSIAALIRLKDSRRALEMLVDLSQFMRANLDQSPDKIVQLVALSTDLEWVKRYVKLQQTRFGDRLDVRYEIDDASLDVEVPTLLLQPIVENALRHGAARQTQPCRVVIEASRQRDRLELRVADDGAGLPPDFELGRHAGTGLRNIQSRLEHLYGGAARLDVRRGAGGGTTVSVTLPAPALSEQKASA